MAEPTEDEKKELYETTGIEGENWEKKDMSLEDEKKELYETTGIEGENWEKKDMSFFEKAKSAATRAYQGAKSKIETYQSEQRAKRRSNLEKKRKRLKEEAKLTREEEKIISAEEKKLKIQQRKRELTKAKVREALWPITGAASAASALLKNRRGREIIGKREVRGTSKYDDFSSKSNLLDLGYSKISKLKISEGRGDLLNLGKSKMGFDVGGSKLSLFGKKRRRK